VLLLLLLLLLLLFVALCAVDVVAAASFFVFDLINRNQSKIESIDQTNHNTRDCLLPPPPMLSRPASIF